MPSGPSLVPKARRMEGTAMKARLIRFALTGFAIALAGCASAPETTAPDTTGDPLSTPAMATERPAVTPSDSLAPAESTELATIYFANALDVFAGMGQRSRDVQVFVDGEPVGLLPDQTYTVTYLEPGYHDVYPDQWLYFEGGRTYLLMTTGGFHEWIFADPEELAGMRCAQATLSEADRDRLLEKGWRSSYAKSSAKSWKRHEEFMDDAGVQAPDGLLPMSLKAARCRGGPDDKVYGNQLFGSEVVIDASGIRCQRGDKVLKIPGEEILHFSYSRYFGMPYLEIEYGDPTKPYRAEIAGLLVREDLRVFSFKQRHYVAEHYNLMFQAVQKSVERCKDRAERAAAVLPVG
jgi:hypothetical protein